MSLNKNSKTVRFKKKTELCETDPIVLIWFSSIRAINIPISGVLLQERKKLLLKI